MVGIVVRVGRPVVVLEGGAGRGERGGVGGHKSSKLLTNCTIHIHSSSVQLWAACTVAQCSRGSLHSSSVRPWAACTVAQCGRGQPAQ